MEEYVEYYNTKRITTKLKGLIPVQYRNQSLLVISCGCYKGMIMIAEENIKLKMDISSVIHKKCVIYFMKRLWITVV